MENIIIKDNFNKAYSVPFVQCQLKKYTKCKYQMQTEHVSCDKQFHSKDLYFGLTKSTDEIPTVKTKQNETNKLANNT